MTINFTKIFQDSWNFVRNQRQITLTFVFAFFLSNFLISLLISSISSNEVMSLRNSSDDLAQILGISTAGPNDASLYFFHQVINFILAAWCLISIHHISQSTPSLNASFHLALQRFFGALIINILLITPIIIGLSEIFFSLIVKKSQPSMFSLLSVGFGIYLCIRFCLTSTHYLITHEGLIQSFKTTWKAGIKRVIPLFSYSMMVYFLLPVVIRQLAAIATNLIVEIAVALLIAFLTVFSLVFTYRFYTIFMQKA
ncbi:hypothetical protein ACNGTP_04675 [Bisgaard Taxon 45]